MSDDSKPSTVRICAAVAGLIAAPTLLAPTAAADTTATVKAQTQRMSAPNLNSQQNGWYNPGDRVTLVCSARGQKVQGFFSFNIPNGGWDDLWYKTTDGNFVADVDIETGTLNVVAPDCITPPQQSPPPVSQSGHLRVPLDGAPRVTRGFGGDGHNGIDYAVPNGTPVYAADSGTVTFEGFGQNNSWMRAEAGICVLIRHGDKFTGYAHLSRTVVDSGQQVTKGQIIGYSGATGMATGPHLHFEVLPLNPNFGNGFSGRIDPAPLLG
ncbi:M23 family metallopeptidase [Mycolicibacterium sp. 018/SC-01/001]|uniref:M23 family metallopeptidase n=1 Tax=Mycolicibacterium sp. 018/SC-01/001 TaxID=2592069 RepID=UPI001C8F78F5|nr:M23 family metallopeptidase [Mycolicibacterium sp. 018/SC-01/001]